MINWFNMPTEGLSNGGQFEIKELTATENKTYEKDGEVYNKVTVNVSGGGSSDFTKADVAITNNRQLRLQINPTTMEDTAKITGFCWDDETGVWIPDDTVGFEHGSHTFNGYVRTGEYISFYAVSVSNADIYTVTGNAEVIPGDASVNPAIPAIIKVTGDCTITIS